jgi:hypothetical protein
MRLVMLAITEKNSFFEAEIGVGQIAFGINDGDLQQGLFREALLYLARLQVKFARRAFAMAGGQLLSCKVDIANKSGDLIGDRAIQLFAA